MVDLILQSWSGGGNWSEVKPSEVGGTADNKYYAKFDYNTMAGSYGTNFEALDMLHVRVTFGIVTLTTLDYISGTETIEPTDSLTSQTFAITEDHVKVLGRIYYYNDASAIWVKY